MSDTDYMETLRKYARWYAAHNWHILALKPGMKEPAHEYGYHGFHDARPDASAWNGNTPYNIGIAIKASGLAVVDGDAKYGATRETFADWYGEDVLDTCQTTTGGGGFHLIFRAPVGVELSKKAGVRRGGRPGPLGMGIDFLPIGYIVAPPSIHPNGNYYQFDDGFAPWQHDTALLLESILAAVTIREPEVRPPLTAYNPDFINRLPARPSWLEDEARSGSSLGGRHTSLTAFACRAIRQCPSEIEAYKLVQDYARSCNPPLSGRELDGIWQWARRNSSFQPPAPKAGRLLNPIDRTKPCF